MSLLLLFGGFSGPPPPSGVSQVTVVIPVYVSTVLVPAYAAPTVTVEVSIVVIPEYVSTVIAAAYESSLAVKA